MKANLGSLAAGILVFWVLSSGFALLVWPDRRGASLVFSAASAGLCFIPSALTMAWALGEGQQTPEQRRLVALGGTISRMFFVLGAGLLLTSTIEYFRVTTFWFWLLAFYLVTLTLEVVIVVRALGSTNGPAEGGTS